MDGQAEAIAGIGKPTDRVRLGRRDLTTLKLSPEEMFVVTRLMGGELRLADLLSATGLPRERSVEVVRQLIATDVFERVEAVPAAATRSRGAAPAGDPATGSAVVGATGGESQTAGRRPAQAGPAMVPSGPFAGSAVARAGEPTVEPVVDPLALDLSADRQRELLALEQRSKSNDPWEVLGLTPGASAEQVRDAYFALAQRFHPDQYFRKRLGSFQGKVEQLFGKVSAAFQKLSRAGENGGPAAAAADLPAALADSSNSAALTAEEGISSLGSDTQLPETDEAGAPAEAPIYGRPRQRFAKALLRRSFAIAEEALAQLAAEEPDALDVPKLRAELSRTRAQHAAVLAFDKGQAHAELGEWDQALKRYEEAAAADPRNGSYVERAARALLYKGDLKEAKQMAERAVELDPQVADFHVTLANAFLKAGMERNARREFEIALKLDPKNAYAKGQVRKSWWKA